MITILHIIKKDMSMRFERLLMIYDLLPVHPRKIGVSDLLARLRAEDVEFDVCKRTLQRNLNTLSGCYLLNVASDGEKNAGWNKRARSRALDDEVISKAANDSRYKDIKSSM